MPTCEQLWYLQGRTVRYRRTHWIVGISSFITSDGREIHHPALWTPEKWISGKLSEVLVSAEDESCHPELLAGYSETAHPLEITLIGGGTA